MKKKLDPQTERLQNVHNVLESIKNCGQTLRELDNLSVLGYGSVKLLIAVVLGSTGAL